MSFSQDQSGNWGYKVGGADSVHPFSKGKPKSVTFTVCMAPINSSNLGGKTIIPTMGYTKADFNPFDMYNDTAVWFDDQSIPSHIFTSYTYADWNDVDISAIENINVGIYAFNQQNRAQMRITLHD